MEPCLFRHGKRRWNCLRWNCLRWFTGAMSFRHGSWSSRKLLQVRVCFNGATSFRHGKRRILNMPPPMLRLPEPCLSDMVGDGPRDSRRQNTLMEPCLFNMVRAASSFHQHPSLPLQWSHVFSDMVSAAGGRRGQRHAGLASMEPCLFRHGKRLRRHRRGSHPARASMEPCLFRHGKPATTRSPSGGSTSFNGAMSFQTW